MGPLKTFHGEGFTFEYPASATLDTGRSFPSAIRGQVVIGPKFAVHGIWPGSVDPVGRDGPAYRLLVASLPNPAGRTLDQFTDSIVRGYRAAAGSELTGSDVTTSKVMIAGHDARMVTPSCGDCWPHEIYLAHGKTVLVS